MDTIFMNSKKNNISYPHRLLLDLTDKKKLKRSDKYVAYQALPFVIQGKM